MNEMSSGWLIEIHTNKAILWYRGGIGWDHFGEPNWTRDALQAVRFVREQDAQAVIESWPAWMGKIGKPIEHLFLEPNANE